MNQYKRQVILVLIIFILLFLFSSVCCLAHSGRTDSKGGHYDHSSGKYHYHHGYSAHQHPNGICPYETEDNYYDVQDDNDFSQSKNDKFSFEFFAKLSSDFTWHTSDIIHIILITVCLIIAYRVVLFEPRIGLWANYKYGYSNADLAGMIVISLICYGYSLSAIFPYDLKGVNFLGIWLLNGFVVLLFVLLCIATPICIAVISFTSERIDKKYLSFATALYVQSLKWPVNNDFLDADTILYTTNQKLEQINCRYYNTEKYFFIEIPACLIEQILTAKHTDEIIKHTESIKNYVLRQSRRGKCRRELVDFFNTLDYLQKKQDLIIDILSAGSNKKRSTRSHSSASRQISLYDLDYSSEPQNNTKTRRK